MSLKQNYDLSEKDCPVYENYVHAEVCAQIERELSDTTNEVARLRELLNRAIEIQEEMCTGCRCYHCDDLRMELDTIKRQR